MWRCLVVFALIMIAVVPSYGHDDLIGFTSCYNGKHCRQDTLVFGIVVAEDQESFTVDVKKALIGQNTQSRIKQIRFAYPIERNLMYNDRLPRLGNAVAVSYLKKDRRTIHPVYLIISKTKDWRNMVIDTDHRTDDDITIERFIRSGGQYNIHSSSKDDTNLRKQNEITKVIDQRSTHHKGVGEKIKPQLIRVRYNILSALIPAGVTLLLLVIAVVMRSRTHYGTR